MEAYRLRELLILDLLQDLRRRSLVKIPMMAEARVIVSMMIVWLMRLRGHRVLSEGRKRRKFVN